MNKIILLLLTLILFSSCGNNVTLDNICLYSVDSVVAGTKEIPKQNSERILVDRHSKKMLLVKHTEKNIIMKDFNDPDVCIELSIEEGRLNSLCDDYLFNGKYVSRILFDDSKEHIIQKLIIFDISSGSYKILEIDNSEPYRICGLDNSFIYLYKLCTQENIITKINYQTLEKEEISFDLSYLGYCVEEESFIGINDKNNICIKKNGIKQELPIKGIRYSNRDYVDICDLYYFTNNKIYYAKIDIITYMKYPLAIFCDLGGLEPVRWYCYDLETKKSKKINNGNGFTGFSFLCEF